MWYYQPKNGQRDYLFHLKATGIWIALHLGLFLLLVLYNWYSPGSPVVLKLSRRNNAAVVIVAKKSSGVATGQKSGVSTVAPATNGSGPASTPAPAQKKVKKAVQEKPKTAVQPSKKTVPPAMHAKKKSAKNDTADRKTKKRESLKEKRKAQRAAHKQKNKVSPVAPVPKPETKPEKPLLIPMEQVLTVPHSVIGQQEPVHTDDSPQVLAIGPDVTVEYVDDPALVELQQSIYHCWKVPAGLPEHLRATAQVMVGIRGEVQCKIVEPSGNFMYDIAIRTALAQVPAHLWPPQKTVSLTFG